MATFYKKDNYDPNDTYDVTKPGVYNNMPAGWNNAANSILVKDGYNICLFDNSYTTMNDSKSESYCTTGISVKSIPKLNEIAKYPGSTGYWGKCCFNHSNCCGSGYISNGHHKGCGPHKRRDWCVRPKWNNSVSSFQLKKDCDNPKWMWDDDCIHGYPEKTTGSCSTKSSKCHNNRIIECNAKNNQSDNCVNFCQANHGSCDDMMKNYCAKPENKDKDACACLNSPALKYNPLCIDGRCASIGYATKTMLDKPCPSTVDCSVYYDIKNVGQKVNFTDATINQRCSASTTNDSESSDSGPDHSTDPGSDPSSYPGTDTDPGVTGGTGLNKLLWGYTIKWWIIASAVSLIVIILLFIGIHFLRGSTATTVTPQTGGKIKGNIFF